MAQDTVRTFQMKTDEGIYLTRVLKALNPTNVTSSGHFTFII
jgi:hypothetical protein